MKIVGYCRYSSESQRDGYSIEAQSSAIKEYCETNKHELVRLYIDEAMTATDDDREEFLNMIADTKLGQFEGIIVHKLDRFARNRYDSAIYGKILDERNIILFSITEPIISEDSPEAGLFRGVIETINEYYSKNLGRESLKGKRMAAKECKWMGGYIPYGFMLDDSNVFTPEPEESKIVLEMFTKIDAGRSLREVAQWLSSIGARTRTNYHFTPTAITRIIKNPVYIGRYVWGLKSKKKNFTPITVENAFPPIVSVELFQRLNAVFACRKKENTPIKRFKGLDYLLTGYLYCLHCGSHLYGFKSTSGAKTKDGSRVGKSYYNYRCSKSKATQKHIRLNQEKSSVYCSLKITKKDPLENFILSCIKKTLFSEQNITIIVEELKRIATSRLPGSPEDIKKVETKIKIISTKIQKLLDVYLEGTIDKLTYHDKQRELDSQLIELKSQLSKFTVKPLDYSFDKIKSAIYAFNADIENDTDEYKKILISTFLERIDISNSEIIIYYKLQLPSIPASTTHTRLCNTTSEWSELGSFSIRKGSFSVQENDSAEWRKRLYSPTKVKHSTIIYK